MPARGSCTQAARQLDLRKAALSQQMQRLEERLGARLLTRTGPGAAGLAMPVTAAALGDADGAQRAARVQAFMDWAQALPPRRPRPHLEAR